MPDLFYGRERDRGTRAPVQLALYGRAHRRARPAQPAAADTAARARPAAPRDAAPRPRLSRARSPASRPRLRHLDPARPRDARRGTAGPRRRVSDERSRRRALRRALRDLARVARLRRCGNRRWHTRRRVHPARGLPCVLPLRDPAGLCPAVGVARARRRHDRDRGSPPRARRLDRRRPRRARNRPRRAGERDPRGGRGEGRDRGHDPRRGTTRDTPPRGLRAVRHVLTKSSPRTKPTVGTTNRRRPRRSTDDLMRSAAIRRSEYEAGASSRWRLAVVRGLVRGPLRARRRVLQRLPAYGDQDADVVAELSARWLSRASPAPRAASVLRAQEGARPPRPRRIQASGSGSPTTLELLV